MLWKSNLPDDMAELVQTARMLSFEESARAEDDEDWDEDLHSGPEIIYARGDGEGADDEEVDEEGDDCEQ